MELARTQGERDTPRSPVGIRITQEELAGMVGARRESVNKELRAFEQRGLLILARGRILLPRPEGLGALDG